MSEVPSTLVHLYSNPAGPFLSVSDLTEEEDAVMDGMTEANTRHPPRFSREKRRRYMAARRRSEERLHAAFVAKRGCPKRRHPYYFIPETPETRGAWPSAKRVRVPLVDIPTEVLSST